MFDGPNPERDGEEPGMASKLFEIGFMTIVTVITCTWAIGLAILAFEVVKLTSSL